ncbi:hypothetical protein CEXT_287621 [Caerostris extrusa]|uniref:Uncharacterized protein n=1 Tax=Caerostris extrusa TaxID=172846 RepID=A0AAV4Q670_CAEEX|nr:hypothetical protein CEXT_287621 [Caerostris extrusa]
MSFHGDAWDQLRLPVVQPSGTTKSRLRSVVKSFKTSEFQELFNCQDLYRNYDPRLTKRVPGKLALHNI